jgi:catechol 2,3-dioxygenase-like lactoylglutathione lyase family enzyme
MAQGLSFSRAAIILSCTDAARSLRFYRDVLGATVADVDEGACAWLTLGGIRITLVPNARRPAEPSTDRAAASLWIEVDDLEGACRAFARQGVSILQEPAGGPLAVIADPDGIIIEVWRSDPDDGA